MFMKISKGKAIEILDEQITQFKELDKYVDRGLFSIEEYMYLYEQTEFLLEEIFSFKEVETFRRNVGSIGGQAASQDLATTQSFLEPTKPGFGSRVGQLFIKGLDAYLEIQAKTAKENVVRTETTVTQETSQTITYTDSTIESSVVSSSEDPLMSPSPTLSHSESAEPNLASSLMQLIESGQELINTFRESKAAKENAVRTETTVAQGTSQTITYTDSTIKSSVVSSSEDPLQPSLPSSATVETQWPCGHINLVQARFCTTCGIPRPASLSDTDAQESVSAPSAARLPSEVEESTNKEFTDKEALFVADSDKSVTINTETALTVRTETSTVGSYLVSHKKDVVLASAAIGVVGAGIGTFAFLRKHIKEKKRRAQVRTHLKACIDRLVLYKKRIKYTWADETTIEVSRPLHNIFHAEEIKLMGDTFEVNKPTHNISDISNSYISGVVMGDNSQAISNLNASGQKELAQALQTLTESVLASRHLTDDEKQDQVSVITEISEKAIQPTANKAALKRLSTGLITALSAVPDVARVVASVTPLLMSLHI